MRFAPIRELASLRLDSSLRTLTLSPAGNDDRRNDNSMAVGFEQMDIVAEFNAPVGGWEALATRRSPCYFGVRLRLGGRGAGHAVWIQSHCNATVGADSEGCAACRVNAFCTNGVVELCPDKTETEGDGHSSTDACTPCRPGTEFLGETCADCAAGRYEDGTGTCTVCPAGTWSATPRAMDSETCAVAFRISF